MASIQQQQVNKNRLFKGTIAVSIIYASISFILLILIWLNERSRGFIGETNFPFALTFTAGMLIIIAILSYKVYNFKIETPTGSTYDNMTCPDFWTLEETKRSELSRWDPETAALMKYRCKSNAILSGNSNVILMTGSSNVNDRKLADMAQVMYGSKSDIYMTGSTILDTTQRKMDCRSIYPQYMSVMDVKENPDIQNALRCAYTQKCNLSWSAVCPDRA